jgi:hypothetical protein
MYNFLRRIIWILIACVRIIIVSVVLVQGADYFIYEKFLIVDINNQEAPQKWGVLII